MSSRLRGPNISKSDISISARKNSSPFNIGALNVRTLLQPEQEPLLAMTQSQYQMDVICLSETRIYDDGIKMIKHPQLKYSLHLYNSPNHHNRGSYGVGFLVSPNYLNAVIEWEPVNERLARLRISGQPRNITLFSVYSPTNQSTESEIETFYDTLENELEKVNNHDIVLVAGDLNAQVGNSECSAATGAYTVGRLCRNGEYLLNFAEANNFRLLNTFYSHKKSHKYTWISPDKSTRNQIDYIMVRGGFLSSFADCRSYWGVHIETDHALVKTSFQFKVKAKSNKKQTFQPDVNKLVSEETKNIFQQALQEKMNFMDDDTSVDSTWEKLRKSVLEASEETIGLKRPAFNRWISQATLDLSEKRRQARIHGRTAAAKELSKEIRRSVRKDKDA